MNSSVSRGIISSLLLFCLSVGAEIPPVVLIHGVYSSRHEMRPTVAYLKKYLPNTYVKNVEIGDGTFSSFWNILTQSEVLAEQLQKDPNLQNGFNIVAHSQGGLVARYYIQRYNSPRVYNLITWATPHRGVYGLPGKYEETIAWLNDFQKASHSFLYSYLFQRFFSVAGYWQDPFHYQEYLNYSWFLPFLNNEKEHDYAEFYKTNICELNNLVLVKSSLEDVVEPVESCHFGFYEQQSCTHIEPCEAWEVFTKDRLGLKTLYESGRLHFKVAHCHHADFQENEENFVNNTLPYLQLDPTIKSPQQPMPQLQSLRM